MAVDEAANVKMHKKVKAKVLTFFIYGPPEVEINTARPIRFSFSFRLQPELGEYGLAIRST